ncbi:unnamed protein product [Prorocentrum cordatum]|uniref:Uncharacterized protein n=2 Tax=Prorocentrum cordatum TaxID=2364126 RepID=A0ABN9PET9_9DINO|nr:unnamed protein product [Polarella glacialis]
MQGPARALFDSAPRGGIVHLLADVTQWRWCRSCPPPCHRSAVQSPCLFRRRACRYSSRADPISMPRLRRAPDRGSPSAAAETSVRAAAAGRGLRVSPSGAAGRTRPPWSGSLSSARVFGDGSLRAHRMPRHRAEGADCRSYSELFGKARRTHRTRRSKYERGGPAGAPSTTLRPGRACRAMPPRRLPECREKTPTEAAARARGTRVEVLHPAKCLRNHGMHTPQRSQPLGLLEAVVATARRGRSARRGRGSSDGRRALACSSCRRPRSSAPGRGPSARPSRGAISLKSVSPPPRAGGPVHEQKGAQGLLPLGQARPAPFSAACPVGARFWQDDPGRSSMAPAGKLLTPERCRKNGPGRAVA